MQYGYNIEPKSMKAVIPLEGCPPSMIYGSFNYRPRRQ